MADGTGALSQGAATCQGSGFVGKLISIERNDNGGSYGVVHLGLATGSPWTDTGPFTDGHVYGYRARHLDAGTASEYSNTPSVTYSDATVTGTGTLQVAPVSVRGMQEGSYSSSLTGLLPGTLYYVRAYATNADGTGYGTAVTFTTDAGGSGATRVGAARFSGSGTVISDPSGIVVYPGVVTAGAVMVAGSGTVVAPSITVERRTGSGSYSVVHSGDDDGTWLDEGPFTSGQRYTYRAKRDTGTYVSEWSNEVTVTFRARGTDGDWVIRRRRPDVSGWRRRRPYPSGADGIIAADTHPSGADEIIDGQ